MGLALMLLSLTNSCAVCQDMSDEQKAKLYEEAAQAGDDASGNSTEAPLDPLIQEQQHKLRVSKHPQLSCQLLFVNCTGHTLLQCTVCAAMCHWGICDQAYGWWQ